MHDCDDTCGCGRPDDACGCGTGCGDGCGSGCCGGCGAPSLPDDGRDKIAMFVVGPIETNCYAYVSDGECLVVDPGASGEKVAQHLPSGVRVTHVVATHGHGDHVGGVAALVRATGASYAICADDDEMARHAGEVGELGRAYDENAPAPDALLDEGDVVEVGTARFRVMRTPGHTAGSICLVGEGTAEHVAFVGDTLFCGACGRTDLAGGDDAAMRASLARLAREVHPHTNLFCGHGEITTMEDELATNPYLLQVL